MREVFRVNGWVLTSDNMVEFHLVNPERYMSYWDLVCAGSYVQCQHGEYNLVPRTIILWLS